MRLRRNGRRRGGGGVFGERVLPCRPCDFVDRSKTRKGQAAQTPGLKGGGARC